MRSVPEVERARRMALGDDPVPSRLLILAGAVAYALACRRQRQASS